MKEPKDDIAETMMKLTDDDNDDDAGDDGDSDDDGDYDDDDDIWLSFTEDGQVTSKTFECLILTRLRHFIWLLNTWYHMLLYETAVC